MMHQGTSLWANSSVNVRAVGNGTHVCDTTGLPKDYPLQAKKIIYHRSGINLDPATLELTGSSLAATLVHLGVAFMRVSLSGVVKTG